mgnify:FL=1
MGAIDARALHVLVLDQGQPAFEDVTGRVSGLEERGDWVIVTYPRGRVVPYQASNVRIYDQVVRHDLARGDEVYVRGDLWGTVETVYSLGLREDPSRVRYTLVYRRSDGTVGLSRRGEGEVRMRLLTPERRNALEIMDYVRDEVRGRARWAGAWQENTGRSTKWRAEKDSARAAATLANVWEWLRRVPPGSALEAYLTGTSSASTGAEQDIIMPFASNLEQRRALEAALSHQLSVIDGPPGTGKTQTILNLVTTLVAQGKTVGIVSGANSAVDNVVEKLTEEGYGFLVANVGNREKVEAFLREQGRLRELREEWEATASPGADGTPVAVDPDGLHEREARLVQLWQDGRDIPRIRAELAATRKERQLLEVKIRESRRPLPDVSGFPVVRRGPEALADLLALARSAPKPHRGVLGLVERIRRYFAYGSLKGVRLDDADTQAALQLQWYRAYEEETASRIEHAEERSRNAGAQEEAREYRSQSRAVLDRALRRRFTAAPRAFLTSTEYLSAQTRSLLATYPVVASTCHSIRGNLDESALLDWVIIDESSQVVIPEGIAALSKARNAVIVGDEKQLGPVLAGWKDSHREPPDPRYDVRSLSLLESVKALGELAGIPRTLLREHYRCRPAIIEFCNRMYYDGQLIAMTDPSDAREPPMRVVRAAPGNHARRLPRGRYSQREIDIIAQLEDLRLLDRGVTTGDKDESGDYVLGIVTPYREQANRAGARVRQESEGSGHARWLAETAHKFQGRGAGTIVFSTVLDSDDTAGGDTGFYDDSRITNVAVSRAKDRVVVVTAHGGVRHSRNVTALLDYITMLDPEQVVESDIVSVFDVLYAHYSDAVRQYAHSKWHGPSRFPSENIIDALLGGVLAETRYARLGYQFQVHLRDVLPHTRRLNEEQRQLVWHGSALDFGVFSTVTHKLVLGIEVDGFRYHEGDPAQRRRDALKDQVMRAYGVPVLRLPTNGSNEEARIRAALDAVEQDPFPPRFA